MDAVGIIPARYGSTRFEGKLLVDFCGKPVIQHTWENAKKSNSIDDLIIATDDKRIYNVAKGFGANVVYTSTAHKSGSDRLTEVAASIDARVIVNIQADEPLLHPSMIDDVAGAILKDSALVMATLCHKIKDAAEIQDPNVVKVVFDRNGFALYFSRAPVPYERMGSDDKLQIIDYFKHIGIYGYRAEVLKAITQLPMSSLEKAEGLEQLRWLENGYKIKVKETFHEAISIDVPEDLNLI